MERKDELAQSLLRRWNSLKNLRQQRDSQRWEAFAYMNHRKKEASITTSPVPEIRLYSTAGQIAGENFINGFMGNLVSVNTNWASFRYESDDMTEQDDIPEANRYLGLCNKRVMSELANSNFYAQDRLASMDAFYGGCSATFIHNDPDNNICVFDTLAPWDWWCDTNPNGVYDTFFYKKSMSPWKAYQQFGEALPKEIIDEAKKNQSQFKCYDFLMCIFPRKDVFGAKGQTIFGKGKKFACVWISLARAGMKGTVISEDGYDMFPVIIHCWEKDGDNPYGTSPVIRALPDLRRLNLLAYETAISVQKVNHAPTVMTQAVAETFSDDPGSRIIVPSMDMAPVTLDRPQTIEGSLNLLNTQIEYIQRIFYNDMFNYLSRQDKVFTATQVNAVKSEELSLLSAIFGNVQCQKIDKTIKYVMAVMAENGRLPQGADKAFQTNGKLKIVLDSMLAQTLRAYTFRDSGIATLEIVERFAQMQQLEPLDNVDMNELIREIVLGNGTDARVLRDKYDVQMIQQQRAQMQAQQQQLAMMQQASEVDRNEAGASNLNNAQGANQYQ